MTTEEISPVKSPAPAHALLNNKALQTIKSDSGAWHEVSSLFDTEGSYKHLVFYFWKSAKSTCMICLSHGRDDNPWEDFREILMAGTASVFSEMSVRINIPSSADGCIKRSIHCILNIMQWTLLSILFLSLKVSEESQDSTSRRHMVKLQSYLKKTCFHIEISLRKPNKQEIVLNSLSEFIQDSTNLISIQKGTDLLMRRRGMEKLIFSPTKCQYSM